MGCNWGQGLHGRRCHVKQCLTTFLPPLEETVFTFTDNDECYFQQDSAPAYKEKKMQKWLQEHISDFIKADDGPPPGRTSIHWIINCGRCWRNLSAPGGTKILIH